MAILTKLGEGGLREQTFELPEAPCTVGGPGADLELPGLGAGLLRVDVGRRLLECPAGSAALIHQGREFERLALTDGLVFEWAGLSLRFDDEARLDAIAPRETALEEAVAPEPWLRLKAGILVDMGRADKRAARRWQDAVADGSFDAQAAAAEILAASAVDDDDSALLERCSRLGRDFLMQPTLRGARGAARATRKAGRNLFAMLLTQLTIVAVFAFLFALGLLVARHQGVGIDGLLDSVLELLPSLE